MRKWKVKLPGNRYFEMASDTPHEDMAAQGYDRYALEEITPMHFPDTPATLAVSTESTAAMMLTVKQMADLLQVGINRAYELTHIDGFPAVRIGKSVRVNRDLLQVWLNENSGRVLL